MADKKETTTATPAPDDTPAPPTEGEGEAARTDGIPAAVPIVLGPVTWDHPLDPEIAASLTKNHNGAELVWVKSGRKDNRVVLWEPSLEHPGGECWIAGSTPTQVAMTSQIAGKLRLGEAVLVERAEVLAHRIAANVRQAGSVTLADLEDQVERLGAAIRAERVRLALSTPMIAGAGEADAPGRQMPGSLPDRDG